jgi:hypothetical protein
MKLTVVVDDKGTFVAVPEDLRAVQDPKQFLTKVSPLVPGMRAH